MTPIQLLIPLVFGLIFAGCATMSPLVRLNPAPSDPVASFNGRPAVYLSVQDVRPRTSLGDLPPRGTEKALSTQSTVPVDLVVQKQVADGLTRAGFHILSAPTENSPQVVIQVKKLEFTMERGGTWSEINGRGDLAVEARAGASTLSKTYAAETGKKWAFNPPVDGHEQYLNQLLTDLLSAFLADEKLLSFLAREQQQ